MKRKFLTAASIAAASVAVAMPSSASATTVDADVACNKPVVECARDLANYAIDQVYVIPETIKGVCDRVFGPGSCGL